MAADAALQRLQYLTRRMDALVTARKLLSEAKLVLGEWDDTLAKVSKRRRGERTKLNGGVLLERAAVAAVKQLKPFFKADGYSTFESWQKAREYVGGIIGVSPATIEDWEKGKPKRERGKSIGARSYRARKSKNAIQRPD